MSWEGYSQNFCEKGHFFHSYMGPGEDEPTKCSCGAPVALCNVVDDTNCDAVGVIPPEVLQTLLLHPEKTETCNLGHVHVTEKAVYRIPTKKELGSLQHCWDYVNQKYEPLGEPTRDCSE